MTFIIGVVILISVITLIVGLIKPSLMIRWGGDEESKTRKKVIKTQVVGVIGTGAQTPDAYKQQLAAEAEIEAAAK